MPSEAEYLANQAKGAKARLRQTARTLADEILAPLSIRPCVARRPWWSLGGAAVTGFVVGLGLRRRGRTTGASAAGGKVHELLAAVNRRVRRVLGSALGAVFVASLRGGAPAPAAPSTNGHDEHAATDDVGS
jgi:hypothetical protein